MKTLLEFFSKQKTNLIVMLLVLCCATALYMRYKDKHFAPTLASSVVVVSTEDSPEIPQSERDDIGAMIDKILIDSLGDADPQESASDEQEPERTAQESVTYEETTDTENTSEETVESAKPVEAESSKPVTTDEPFNPAENKPNNALENTTEESTITPPEEIKSVEKEERKEDVNKEEIEREEQKNTTDQNTDNRPMLAIVIDDMGINQVRTKEILSLRAPLTTAFLTYGKNLQALAEEAVLAGDELLIHTPMEPKGPASLAPDTLMVNMDKEQIESGFATMLKKFENLPIRGINNHMGSKMTESAEKLGYVLEMLKERHLFFLDSKTTPSSVGQSVATKKDIPYIARDVFLDNQNDFAQITQQLQRAEKIARQRGYAVAIGHPKSQTYAALKAWLENKDHRDIRLVHISELIEKLQQH